MKSALNASPDKEIIKAFEAAGVKDYLGFLKMPHWLRMDLKTVSPKVDFYQSRLTPPHRKWHSTCRL